MDKRQISDTLDEIALLLELSGENTFKTRAYQNASRAIQNMDRDITEVVERGEISSIRGVGKSIAEKITTLVEEGSLPYLEDLREKTDPGLLDLLKVPGLGPKRVKEIYQAYGIASLGELEYAAQSNTLQELPGFGEKMQSKILEGIAVIKKNSERTLLSKALAEAEAILAAMAGMKIVQRAALAGSLRRRKETVKDVDIVVSTTDPKMVMEQFIALPRTESVISHGDTKSSIRLDTGLQVDLRAVSDEEFPYTLHHFTGSKEHNVALRARAQSRGLKINEYGLWKGEDRIPCKDEKEFFAALGLSFIEPELREDQGEIDAAENDDLPNLLTRDDLKGILHNHTIYSDGVRTPREMAEAARERGYLYIGLTDHSQSARYANGMQPADVKRYLRELNDLNSELDGIRIFKGTECDILPDGTLDYPDEILAQFDFVVGSVHSSFGMPEDEMTERVLRAMQSQYLNVLGHPTGRLLLSREPYAINMAKICATAAERGVAIEINANPHRLDLDWREIKGFRDLGGWVSINPDAHRIEGLDDVQYGVSIARKGWVTRERVLNALTPEELDRKFQDRRQK